MILACEQCRKRKVRCSGTAPCTNCQRHLQECFFEHNRRRRGPRPKRHLDGQQVAAVKRTEVANTTSGPLPVAQIQCEDAPTRITEGRIEERAVLFSHDDREAWRVGLVGVIGSTHSHLNSQHVVSVEHILHLVLVFCTTVNSQQVPLLSSAAFFKALQVGNTRPYLCYAMASAAVRFSRHKLSRRAGLDEALAAQAREQMDDSEEPDEAAKFEQVLTLSVLSVYEECKGNGLQAWHDISLAFAFTDQLKHSPTALEDERIRMGLPLVSRYLSMSQVFNSIGHGIQSANHATRLTSSSSNTDSLHDQIPKLVSILSRCIALCKKDFTRLSPSPWSGGSQYMALKQEIDSLSILHAGELALEDDIIELLQQKDSTAGDYVLRFSLLYTIRILLNRPFLPIGLAPANGMSDISAPSHSTGLHTNAGDCDRPVPTKRAKLLVSSRRVAVFPRAPAPFCEERIATCIRSARGVVLRCRQVLDLGTFLLPPFLGYSLFLAGLVFLNQLHIEDNQSRLEEYVDHLKTIFTVLGAMRAFYTPANLWVDTLFQVHASELHPESTTVMEGHNKLFNGFFQRFSGIAEPPYCSLSSIQATLSQMSMAPLMTHSQDRSASRRADMATMPQTPHSSSNGRGSSSFDVQGSGSASGINMDAEIQSPKGGPLLSDYSKAIGEVLKLMPAGDASNEIRQYGHSSGQVEAPAAVNQSSHQSSRRPRTTSEPSSPQPGDPTSSSLEFQQPQTAAKGDSIAAHLSATSPLSQGERGLAPGARHPGTGEKCGLIQIQTGEDSLHIGANESLTAETASGAFFLDDEIFINAAYHADDFLSAETPGGSSDTSILAIPNFEVSSTSFDMSIPSLEAFLAGSTSLS